MTEKTIRFQVAEFVAAQSVVQRLFREDTPAAGQAGQGRVLGAAPERPGHVRERIVPAAPQAVQAAGHGSGPARGHVRPVVVVRRLRRRGLAAAHRRFAVARVGGGRSRRTAVAADAAVAAATAAAAAAVAAAATVVAATAAVHHNGRGRGQRAPEQTQTVHNRKHHRSGRRRRWTRFGHGLGRPAAAFVARLVAVVTLRAGRPPAPVTSAVPAAGVSVASATRRRRRRPSSQSFR